MIWRLKINVASRLFMCMIFVSLLYARVLHINFTVTKWEYLSYYTKTCACIKQTKRSCCMTLNNITNFRRTFPISFFLIMYTNKQKIWTEHNNHIPRPYPYMLLLLSCIRLKNKHEKLSYPLLLRNILQQ